MKYCEKCVMPDTRPRIKFDENGVCYPCLAAERKKDVDWEKRQKQLEEICTKYRRKDGHYDCVIPASGGKDSIFQAHIMKEEYNMNPLAICVSDSYRKTDAGRNNMRVMSDKFGIDVLQYNLNHKTMRNMTRIAFEEFGSPNWPIDLGIYSVPLKLAYQLKIKLIIYGENIAYEYGGPEATETYSAKDQIKNDVVKPIDWEWWHRRGIDNNEISMIEYPRKYVIDHLDPIYLSYFYPWDGRKNYEYAKSIGFKDLKYEWVRSGFIEQYDQIDSVGYLLHPQLKYPKYGHARATDVACNWIRNGYITRDEGIELVKKHDHILDDVIVEDFAHTNKYKTEEVYNIIDKLYNIDIFTKNNGKWELNDPIWEQ